MIAPYRCRRLPEGRLHVSRDPRYVAILIALGSIVSIHLGWDHLGAVLPIACVLSLAAWHAFRAGDDLYVEHDHLRYRPRGRARVASVVANRTALVAVRVARSLGSERIGVRLVLIGDGLPSAIEVYRSIDTATAEAVAWALAEYLGVPVIDEILSEPFAKQGAVRSS